MLKLYLFGKAVPESNTLFAYELSPTTARRFLINTREVLTLKRVEKPGPYPDPVLGYCYEMTSNEKGYSGRIWEAYLPPRLQRWPWKWYVARGAHRV